MHNGSPIIRRKSTRIYVGKVPIGDGAPIAVQSMTNTKTTDVDATVAQIKALERVGVDIVRVSIPTMDAAEAFKLIKQQSTVPLVADIHFDYRIALKVAEYGVDCLRINPGNIGNESRIREVVACARDYNIPIRIGINGGSLEKIFRRNMVNLHQKPCLNPRCVMSISLIVSISISLKSVLKPPMSSWPSIPIVC